MRYNYQTERSKLFTEEAQETFLKIRDRVNHLIGQSGAVMMKQAICEATGDSYFLMACVDRLVELKELTEITFGLDIGGQFRVFIHRNQEQKY